MRNSKILYVIGGRSFSENNLGRKISEVIAVWRREDVKVEVICGKDLITSKNPANYGSQEIHDSTWRNKKYLQYLKNSYSEIKDLLHDLKLYRKIEKDFLNEELDLIWERSSRLHWSGLRLARKKNIPFILEWKDHLINYKSSLLKLYAETIENRKIREATYIVVESEVLKRELINHGVRPDKILIALNAVNPEEFRRNELEGNKLKAKLGIPAKNIIVGYLGSYAFYHNSELLIHAAKKILKKHKDVTFLLVGNGKDYNHCKNLASEYDILDKGLIMLNGVAKEKVPQILSAIDISVLPGSTDIICPIKIMEYMAAGTATIAPDYLCNREVINSGRNGLLFTPEDVDDLTNKIIFLMKNKEKKKELATEGAEYVKENLLWEHTWGKVLKKILKNESSY
ncbi:glycosyltransferase family 4 protein [Salinimicrobium tongyeongense]|uniref:Glycosyltransferase family 4 protein n=1 Tax=Salinimicrobium tongyeongense TaxID=2809707 RepID=A0ABY6NP22_9FLAO|nr:glycosyltransferase family 4 protein [Salinimicrobium tongyeongense]UZH54651.1 glycosyltransferase family 4 protein [Salinimicrobium tongyeongense]